MTTPMPGRNSEGTGGNGPLPGSVMMSKSLSGATQHVHPSVQQPGNMIVNAESAQISAANAKEILDLLRGLDIRMQGLEGKVDRLLSLSTAVQTIKNEMTTLKAGLATIEGMITTVKIMDPRTPSHLPVEEIKKNLSTAPVIISGPLDDSFTTADSDLVVLDELARPTVTHTKKIVRKPEPKRDLSGQKLMLIQLAGDCIGKPEVKANLVARIHAATTDAQLSELKKQIIRSAI